MAEEQQSRAAYYRNIAAEIRELARRTQIAEVRDEMLDLAERFERMAVYVENRRASGAGWLPSRRGRSSE